MKNTIIMFGLLLMALVSIYAKCNTARVEQKTTHENNAAMNLSTDKARYNPGDQVVFTLSGSSSEPVTVRYRWLDRLVDEQTVSGNAWNWTPPATDFVGYLVEVSRRVDGAEVILCNGAVDVSSDWTRFPRYGFLHFYGAKPQAEIDALMKYLTRHHINGLQYYDWHHAHHKPLAGTPSEPWDKWPDLVNETIYKSTVDGFINTAHAYNIASMWYDLCFGAFEAWEQDGVSSEWFIFDKADPVMDNVHQHPLTAPFRSSIYIVDPSNPGWLDYFTQRVDDVYAVFDFDGYHIDQLGDRGTVYDYHRRSVDLRPGYETFLRRMKTEFPDRKHCFNAVSRWGQSNISAANPDFFYNEVWDTDDFRDFSDVIFENLSLNPNKNSVLAAYANYNIRAQSGAINTPGVLLSNAALFALGGARIELGEHMLTSEYFLTNNLKMDCGLQKEITRYYDFLTAYENILRDGGEFNTEEVSVSTSGDSHTIGSWPPAKGQITKLCRRVGDRQVIHLLNFETAVHLDPRDADANQREPKLINSLKINVDGMPAVDKVWVATPDPDGKMYEEVPFVQENNRVTITVPMLKYWMMVVLEK